MAIVVIGGQTRKVGKTSVVAGLIAALPEFHWTAVKISQHGHGSADWEVTEEHDGSGETDTSRFLVAGAVRALWVRAGSAHLANAVADLKGRLAGTENVMIESTRVVKFLQPDIFLLVLDPGNPDFKESARELITFADGILCSETAGTAESAGKPMFVVRPPSYVTPEIVDFVKAGIERTARQEFRKYRKD